MPQDMHEVKSRYGQIQGPLDGPWSFAITYNPGELGENELAHQVIDGTLDGYRVQCFFASTTPFVHNTLVIGAGINSQTVFVLKCFVLE